MPEHLLRCPADTGGRSHLGLAEVVDGRTEPEPDGVELLREIVHARGTNLWLQTVVLAVGSRPLYVVVLSPSDHLWRTAITIVDILGTLDHPNAGSSSPPVGSGLRRTARPGRLISVAAGQLLVM